MSLKDQTLKGLTWDLSGRIISQVVSFFISIILARLLLPKDFGILAMVNAIVAIANIFIDFGFNTSLIQRQDLKEEHYSSVFIFNIVIGFCLAALLFSFSERISTFYRNETVSSVARVMSLIFVFNSLGSIFKIKFYKDLNFKFLSIGSIIGTISGGILGVVMALNSFGVWSLVAQALCGSVITSTFFFINSKWLPKIKFCVKSLKELWSFSFSIFLATVVGVLFGQLDSLSIGRLFSSAHLGYYYRAKSMESMLYEFTSQSLLSVLFPTLSRVKDDKERFKAIILNSFHIIMYFSVSILGLLYLTSKDLIILLFTEKWLQSVDFFNLLLLSGFVYPINSLFNSILASRGNSKSFLNVTLIRYLILSPAYIVLYYFGIYAFLYSFIILTLLSLFFSIRFVCRDINMSINFFIKTIAKYVFTTIIIVSIIKYYMYFRITDIILQISVISISYIICNIIFFSIIKAEGPKLLFREIMAYKNKISNV